MLSFSQAHTAQTAGTGACSATSPLRSGYAHAVCYSSTYTYNSCSWDHKTCAVSEKAQRTFSGLCENIDARSTACGPPAENAQKMQPRVAGGDDLADRVNNEPLTSERGSLAAFTACIKPLYTYIYQSIYIIYYIYYCRRRKRYTRGKHSTTMLGIKSRGEKRSTHNCGALVRLVLPPIAWTASDGCRSKFARRRPPLTSKRRAAEPRPCCFLVCLFRPRLFGVRQQPPSIPSRTLPVARARCPLCCNNNSACLKSEREGKRRQIDTCWGA